MNNQQFSAFLNLTEEDFQGLISTNTNKLIKILLDKCLVYVNQTSKKDASLIKAIAQDILTATIEALRLNKNNNKEQNDIINKNLSFLQDNLKTAIFFPLHDILFAIKDIINESAEKNLDKTEEPKIKNQVEIIEKVLSNFDQLLKHPYYSTTWKRDRELLFKILKRTLGKVEDLVALELAYSQCIDKQNAEINDCLLTIYYLFEDLNPIMVKKLIGCMLKDYQVLANNGFKYSDKYKKYFKQAIEKPY